MWQLDASGYRSVRYQLVTVNQHIHDSNRFDIISGAFEHYKNSKQAEEVLIRVITEYAAQQEALIDNYDAYNRLLNGIFGLVKIYLAPKGSMPITQLVGGATARQKNERLHRT